MSPPNAISGIIAADGTAYSTSSSENPNDQDLMNHIRRKRTRTVTTPFQSRVLRKVLAQTSFPSTEMRLNLATALGMNPRTVQIWFQNQRQKAKNRQAAQQEKWAASNIFFHNLTVMPSAQQPRRTSVTVTLDKILPPTTEDPTRAYLDGEHRKRRKSSAANLSAANITLSVNPKPSPTPTHVSPTNSAHIGSSRSLKHQQPQQFIMTTAADDMVQHHAATSVVPLQHPLYAQPMPMSPVFSTGFVQHTSTTAAVAQHNLLSAFPYASPAHTGAYAGFSNLALAPHEQQQSHHHHHHQQHHHQSTMTAAAAAAAAAAASNPFGYMNMIPTLDLLASAALEDEGFVIDQQQDGGMDGKHGNAYGVEHGDEEEDDDVANRMVSVHGGVEVNGHEVVVHDAIFVRDAADSGGIPVRRDSGSAWESELGYNSLTHNVGRNGCNRVLTRAGLGLFYFTYDHPQTILRFLLSAFVRTCPMVGLFSGVAGVPSGTLFPFRRVGNVPQQDWGTWGPRDANYIDDVIDWPIGIGMSDKQKIIVLTKPILYWVQSSHDAEPLGDHNIAVLLPLNFVRVPESEAESPGGAKVECVSVSGDEYWSWGSGGRLLEGAKRGGGIQDHGEGF
ncbi:hypothetical protein BC936DRAFT_146980 [Jimgerdemannia flammicorona]|uniref:Homeobox domain-containing protein n=1 Tax=Jimgerdemannia flammicorona TaxID=994334 RepID=A0A433D6I0_9FUNG|nr:hypothetical protein BC936DRAFT_146980 [Jimgerdemannia flammicorona]